MKGDFCEGLQQYTIDSILSYEIELRFEGLLI